MEESEVIPDAVKPTRRRRHSKEFKTQVVRAARQPNVSIAAVALHYRLDANMVRSWVAAQEELDAAAQAREAMTVPQAKFIPLQMGEAGPMPTAPDIQIEVRRGAATFSIRWPSSAAADCAMWLQGWLR